MTMTTTPPEATASAVTPDRVERAVRRGKDWLLNNQITPDTPHYDVLNDPGDAVNDRPGFPKASRGDNPADPANWTTTAVPGHIVGGYYGNVWRIPTSNGQVFKRQYYNTWHTAQAAVALLDYLDFDDDPAVRNSVDMAWAMLRRCQLTEGEFAGALVEVSPDELEFPLRDYVSLGHTHQYARSCYASYDSVETLLFPLELHRRRGDAEALAFARRTADFLLERHGELAEFRTETGNVAISGFSNDAAFGRLARATGDARYDRIIRIQLQRLVQLGLDLRAGNNIRNLYWDATCVAWAAEHGPEDLRPLAMAKLAFLGEILLGGQKASGVLWYRFREPGVPDDTVDRKQDGAATSATITIWGKLYDLTGDARWLEAIRRAVAFALTQQYPDDDDISFAGAFEYAGWMEQGGLRFEFLRDIGTLFGLRALLPLLTRPSRWSRDFWSA